MDKMLDSLKEMRNRHGLREGFYRRFRRFRNRFLAPCTEASIAQDIERFGVRTGDVVLVHSAFSKLGYVKGGPEAFIRALWRVIGSEGTIMMPSFVFRIGAYEYAKQGLLFDVRSTPVAVGLLQEYFRTRAGTLRSLHPTHPYCAAGKHARAILADHHLSPRPFGDNTPVTRFIQLRGKALMVGTTLRTFTESRVIEDAIDYPFPVYAAGTMKLPVRDESGREFMMETLVHSPIQAPLRNAQVYVEPFFKRGIMRTGTIGLADCLIIECGDLIQVLKDLLQEGVIPYSTSLGAER